MIPQLWENKHLPYWLLLWSCSSGRPSTLHYSIFPQCNWWLSWLEISCWKEETLKGRQLPAETSRGTWKSCLNGISAWRAFEGWRQIPVYLSFLEVIHIGGFLANQPKNIQWSIRFQRKSKASFSASPRLRSQNCHTSNLLTVDTSECWADLDGPWRPAGYRQGLCHQLLQTISSLFSLIPPHWEIRLLSAQILSTQEVALCQWGCLLCGELANRFGSELIVIYLKCEHLSEAADGGSRVELPEPRAGSISLKCEAHTN